MDNEINKGSNFENQNYVEKRAIWCDHHSPPFKRSNGFGKGLLRTELDMEATSTVANIFRIASDMLDETDIAPKT